jgi:hypothetical protein
VLSRPAPLQPDAVVAVLRLSKAQLRYFQRQAEDGHPSLGLEQLCPPPQDIGGVLYSNDTY